MSNVLALKPDQADLSPSTTSASLILSGDAMERIFKFAEMMAKGTATVPKHLQGNPSDCLAVVMQATQWGMNPFAVAQKTHVTQGGALGYEAQLISAVITANAPVTGAPEYEYIGNWSKVLGKVEERKSDKGGKYYVATYTKADEEGLGVTCRMTMKGEAHPRELTVMLSQCYPRFSTQWATDPKQQISYVAIRKWSRMFAPGVILGVNEVEETTEQAPRDMGPADVVQPTASAKLQEDAKAAAAGGKASFSKWFKTVKEADVELLKPMRPDLEQIWIKADKERTVDTAPKASEAPKETIKATGEIVVTFEEVMQRLDKATTEDGLYVAYDWANAIEDQSRIGEIENRFNERLAQIRGGK